MLSKSNYSSLQLSFNAFFVASPGDLCSNHLPFARGVLKPLYDGRDSVEMNQSVRERSGVPSTYVRLSIEAYYVCTNLSVITLAMIVYVKLTAIIICLSFDYDLSSKNLKSFRIQTLYYNY